MPAVVRGGPPKPRRPRAEAPASPSKGKPAPRGAQPAAKLHAAKGVGLSPTVALTVAGAALGLGLL
jgi:cell division protein FtsQ